MANGNGFSRTVFWTLILACFTFAGGSYVFSYAGQTKSISIVERVAEKLTDAIVANDRMRQQDKSELQCKVDATNQSVNTKLDKMQEDLTAIKVSIARLGK